MNYRKQGIQWTMLALAGAVWLPSAACAEICPPNVDRYICDVIKKTVIMAATLSVKTDVEVEELVDIGKIYRGRKPSISKVRMQAGVTYLLVMACDEDCRRSELTLFDSDGDFVQSGDQTDSFSALVYSPPRTQDYYVRSAIPYCTAYRCSFAVALYREAPSIDTAGVFEAVTAKPHDYVLIDARSAEDFDKSHLPMAISIPADDVERGARALPADKDKALIVYCVDKECTMRSQVATELKLKGYRNILRYGGGIVAWQQANHPLVAGNLSTSGMRKLLDRTDIDYTLVDARPAAEFEQGHIAGAINVPYTRAAAFFAAGGRGLSTSEPLVFYCHFHDCGMRVHAAAAAWKAGYKQIYMYSDGISGWQASGQRLVSGSPTATRQSPVEPDPSGGSRVVRARPATSLSPTGMIGTRRLSKLLEDKADYLLIDVREPEDYAAGHIPTAVSLPFDDLANLTAPGPGEADKLVIFYGWDEERGTSLQASQKARDAGYRNVATYLVGIRGWKLSQNKVVRDIWTGEHRTVPADGRSR